MAIPATKTDNFASAEIELSGVRLVLDPNGCLFWPEEQILVVSDLHLEKGSSLAMRRTMLAPPYDTKSTLETLGHCLDCWQPKTVISLGDSFHDEAASDRLPKIYREHLASLMSNREWVWISGNHDPVPPKELGGVFSTYLEVGSLNFTHEPLCEFNDGEIAGHLHPAARIHRRGKSVRRRCAVGDGRRLILPAFGAFTGGLSIRDEAFDGLFDKGSLFAWLLGQNAVYPVNGKQVVR